MFKLFVNIYLLLYFKLYNLNYNYKSILHTIIIINNKNLIKFKLDFKKILKNWEYKIRFI
jgi:hypothetical protein